MKPTHAKTRQSCASYQAFGSHATRLALALCLMLATALAPAVLFPTAARADDNVAYVRDSSGKETYYTDWDSAKSAAYGEGNTLVMLKDWEASGTVGVADSKSLTIDMNGHTIKGDGSGSVIRLYQHSDLTLTSSEPTTKISFRGFRASDGAEVDMELTTGGLVTGGRNTNGAGVDMDSWSHLTLDGVAVAGNYSGSSAGGGIYTTLLCTVDAKNGASIRNNKTDASGGGFDIGSDKAVINLENASICENYAGLSGGGLYSSRRELDINLTKGGSINDNVAQQGGGGLYFRCSMFYIDSSDKTGSISGNKAMGSSWWGADEKRNGGGIYIHHYSGVCNSYIDGVTFSNNYSAYEGGAVWDQQEVTRFFNCTFSGNTAERDGGAMHISNSGTMLKDCTITGNACNLKGENYEGGGIFVSYKYDVEMYGVCKVTGNTRGKDSGNADDVFLSQNVGDTIRAYITGNLSKGSKVGVRNGTTGDRRIAKNLTYETKDCLFVDLSGYYVSYGTDEGGDAWQRHREVEFTVTVDGQRLGSYKPGTAVSVNATVDPSKVFKGWNEEQSTSNIFDDETKTSAGLTFSMPQNDVTLVADYVTRISEFKLAVDAPIAGQALPTTGVLTWDDGQGRIEDAPISWLEVTSSGNVPASGAAKYGVSYVAVLSLEQDIDSYMAYDLDIDAAKQIVWIGGAQGAAASASVDAAGRLTITSEPYATEKPSVTNIAPVAVTVKKDSAEGELRSLLPTAASARTNIGTTVSLAADASGADLAALVQDGKVVVPEGGSATVLVPVSSDEVQVPDNLNTVKVTVTVTEEELPEKPASPTVELSPGSYSTSDATNFDANGNLQLPVSCDTSGATVSYVVSLYNAASGEWSEKSSGTGDQVLLPKASGLLASYEVEVWASVPAADDESVESDHVHLSYAVDDVRMVTVTVNYADTAIAGQHGTKTADDYPVAYNAGLAVTAPDRPGYVFEKWQAADGSTLGTSTTYTFGNVLSDFTITAVYNPVVSELNVGFDEPVAHQHLATSATATAVAGESETAFDIASYFAGSGGKADVSWSPTADGDGEAEHMRSYTAALTFKQGNATGVKYVLDPGATIEYNGNPIDGSLAYVSSSTDGSKSLCISFESTGPLEDPDLGTISDVELTYERAYGYQLAQDAGQDESWDLPKSVLVTFGCGCSTPLDITWDEVTGFDKSVLAAQEFTVAGKVEFPSYVDGESPQSVEVTVKIAAPETVATPTASVAPGTYIDAQAVSLSCETDDAVIRYTTDGTEPTEDSPEFTDAIEVSETTTIKAKAFRNGWASSETATFEYKIGTDPEPDPEPKPEPKPSPSPEPTPDADTDGDDDADQGEGGQPDGSAKALPGTGDPSSTAAVISAAIAGLGALAAGLCRRK